MRRMRGIMRSVILLGLLAFLLVGAAGLVLAVPTPPTNVYPLASSSRQLPDVSTTFIDAVGGNVTEINIDALTITKSWQGYYGNVTGNIHLDDAGNNSFYVWGNATTLSGEIYASRNSTIQWMTINCSTGAQRAAEETYLTQSPSDGDSVTNTFNWTNHPSFLVGMQNITSDSCFSTNIYVNGSAQNASFYQMLLADTYSNIVYTTLIEDDQYAYNGQRADFQLIVGESEKPGNLGPSTYYFFVEIN